MVTIRGSAGGLPLGRIRPPGLILLTLALVGLAQTGCQSGGCGGCGVSGFGSKISNRVQALGAKVFNHGSTTTYGEVGGVGGGCCGGGIGGGAIEEGQIIEGGVPIAPGGMAVPAPLIPAPTESAPTELKPLEPSPTSTPPTATPPAAQTRTQPTGSYRSGYQANRRGDPSPRNRFGDVSRAVHNPTPVASAATSNNALDHLPPVDLSPNVKLPDAAPVPSEKNLMPPLDTTPAAAPTPTPTPTPATEVSSGAEAGSAAVADAAATSVPTLAAPVSPGAAPGIARCNSVDPHLMGGSLPTAEGLDWLKQRGYKTFLDLRGRAEVDPAFVDSVSDRGMVYIALPILANRLDSNRLARFDDLVKQSQHRPLYFCDLDGSRAGLAWYIHRIVVDRYDAQTAAHEAEEMGLAAVGMKQADAYLKTRPATNRNRAAAAAATAPAPAQVAAPTPSPAQDPVNPPVPTAVAPAEPAAKVAQAEPLVAEPVVPPPAAVAVVADSIAAEPEPAIPALPASDLASQPPAEPEPAIPATEPGPASAPTLPPVVDEVHEGGDVLRPQAANATHGRLPAIDPAAIKPIAALVLAAIGLPLAYWSRTAFSVARVSRANRLARARRSLAAPASSDA